MKKKEKPKLKFDFYWKTGFLIGCIIFGIIGFLNSSEYLNLKIGFSFLTLFSFGYSIYSLIKRKSPKIILVLIIFVIIYQMHNTNLDEKKMEETKKMVEEFQENQQEFEEKYSDVRFWKEVECDEYICKGLEYSYDLDNMVCKCYKDNNLEIEKIISYEYRDSPYR